MSYKYSNYIYRALSFLGLYVIGLGMGGIKPCVGPFGAEQFKLPEQSDRLEKYWGESREEKSCLKSNV